MSRLEWGAAGSRVYEAGVDRGVLFPPAGAVGVPWNGLISVKEAPGGGEVTPFYMDGIKYFQIASGEDFRATIQAFNAPPEFAACEGVGNIYAGLMIYQQPRKSFGFSYRTLVGNDLAAEEHGYKLHLVYSAVAKASERNRVTIGNETDPTDFSWDIETVPPAITGFKPSAHFVIDSRMASSDHLTAVENIVYGQVAGPNPRLPTVTELVTIFGS